MLLVGSAGFLVWSTYLVFTPGGSHAIEPLQLAVSAITLGYAIFAIRKGDKVSERRCRYILLGFAVFGVVVVLGLASDRTTSRTWARLGWAALVFGYLGSLIAWMPVKRQRLATLTMSLVGLVLIGAGVALTVNCDPGIQRTWCNPDWEQEQILAEQIEVDGELERLGRASGGALGPALATYFIPEGASITEITDPPGEWSFEERPTQSIEIERGRFTTDDERYSDCRLDVKVEAVPAGHRQTVYVSCGLTL